MPILSITYDPFSSLFTLDWSLMLAIKSSIGLLPLNKSGKTLSFEF